MNYFGQQPYTATKTTTTTLEGLGTLLSGVFLIYYAKETSDEDYYYAAGLIGLYNMAMGFSQLSKNNSKQ